MNSLQYSEQTAFGETVGAPTLVVHPSAPSEDEDAASARTAVRPSTGSLPPTSSAVRTTTLPRIEGDGDGLRLVAETRARYEPVKILGEGGMGEVVLVQDNDIARKVAVKRLLGERERSSPGTLARFVDEVRTVGRLEHPNIVPIHDVGIDEQGRYYFVMKYVEGETLEHIIERLAAKDPEYHRKYTFERRIEIFMSLLNALAYAHANGVVHRDVKPANVMVGRYGEVVLMDWGIAKPIAQRRDFAAAAEATLGEARGERGRMFATRVGYLVGTPAYMSPEQARGENDRIDTRSDLYSAAVLFHELITTRHYLEGHHRVDDMIEAVIAEDTGRDKGVGSVPADQPKPPAELFYVMSRGLEKDPAQRYQSAAEVIEHLQIILEGRMHVHCRVTLMKRFLREAGRFVDRRPDAAWAVVIAVVLAVLFAGVQLVRIAVA